MLDPTRWFTYTQIEEFHWQWMRWRRTIRVTLTSLALASVTGGMYLTWYTAYDEGYQAAVSDAATLCVPLLKLFTPGAPK